MDTTIKIIPWNGIKISFGNKKNINYLSFKKEELETICGQLNQEADKRKNRSNIARIKRIAHVAHLLTIYHEPKDIMKIVKIASLPIFISYLKIIDYEIQRLHQKTRQ